MRQINLKVAEEKWVTNTDDKDIQIKIRPFPISQGMYMPGISNEDIWQFSWKKFNYCITEWKGIIDDDKKPLECNEENKRLVYDYSEDIMMWASTEIQKLKEDSLLEEKKT